MHKRTIIICLTVVCFLVSPLAVTVSSGEAALSTSQSIATTGLIVNTPPQGTAAMHGACVMLNNFVPGTASYQPNAWQLLKQANINTICVEGGIGGDAAHFNVNNYPNEWAQNLNNFLSTADQNGIRVYFGELGTTYGTLFGIVSPGDSGSGPYPASTITQAKAIVDKLAGNNPLGHNFITDPRIVMWITSNEIEMTNSTILTWNQQLASYIRSLGGKATVACPVWNGNYNAGSTTVPLFRGYVDFLDMHNYELRGFWNNGNPMDYNSYLAYYKNEMLNDVVIPAQNNGYSLDQCVIGEWGIWVGYGDDQGISYTFTDAQRATYYQAVFDAAAYYGIKNLMLFDFFPQGNDPIKYNVVDVNGSFYPYLLNIIQTAYGSG